MFGMNECWKGTNERRKTIPLFANVSVNKQTNATSAFLISNSGIYIEKISSTL